MSEQSKEAIPHPTEAGRPLAGSLMEKPSNGREILRLRRELRGGRLQGRELWEAAARLGTAGPEHQALAAAALNEAEFPMSVACEVAAVLAGFAPEHRGALAERLRAVVSDDSSKDQIWGFSGRPTRRKPGRPRHKRHRRHRPQRLTWYSAAADTCCTGSVQKLPTGGGRGLLWSGDTGQDVPDSRPDGTVECSARARCVGLGTLRIRPGAVGVEPCSAGGVGSDTTRVIA
jgi:hypothetical protein